MNAARLAPAALTLAASAVLIPSGGASAASVDLRGDGGWINGALDVELTDGNTARVTATSTRRADGRAVLGRWGNGLGVWNGHRDDHRVDGHGSTDTVWFDFDTAFRLTGVDLTYVSSASPETLRVLDGDGGILGDFDALASDGTHSARLDLALLGLDGVERNRFGLSAVGSHSAFKIEGLQGVSAVPTPTAAAAGIALLVGGVMRRRRREPGAEAA